jgi:hypothetical protein
MKTYRAFPVNGADHIVAPPWILACENDQEVMTVARDLARNHPKVEIWDGSRRVGCLIADAVSGIET